jgi:nicotinate-nucleotide adenylyltransferase
MPARIGLFGGTFDPPHIGHLILAAEAYSQLGLDRLLWVLTPNPPHKRGRSITPLEYRLEMVRLAIAADHRFELSRVDIDRKPPHYALDTVNIVARQNPTRDLTYIMGGDSLSELPTWHQPARLVAALHSIGVMRRPGDRVDLPALEKIIPGLTAKVRYLDVPLIDIAAHEIRRRAENGLPFRYFLPPAVFEYILEHNLYC